MRRADGNLWARFAAVCVAAAGCGASDPEIVRIDAPDFDPTRASRGFVAAVFHEGGRERSVWLRVLRAGRLAEPWLTVGVHGERGGEPEAHLIVAAPFALLNHHLAASHASLAEGRLRTSQLAVVGDRLGLLFNGPPAGAARTESLATLEAGELARVLALCEVLGAWRTLARGRVEVDADGRALLPFFVPSTPGDWRGLMAESLETFLPAELGARVAREPALRAALEAHLYSFTGELPGLGETARALAERVPPVDLDDDIAKLDALFTTSFAAIRGYLDSVWIETLFERIAPDRVRLSLVVNAVAPVRIVELRSRVARSLLVAESVPVGALRLRAAEGGSVWLANTGPTGLVFPIATRVDPVPHGTEHFETVRLDFELEGIDGVSPALAAALERLEPVVLNLATGQPVPADHLHGFAWTRDARFEIGPEDEDGAFFAALPTRLVSPGGEASPVADRARRALVVPAGAWEVRGDLLLPAGFSLILEAGCDLRIAPGRSILVRGSLLVRGTAERPVRVRGLSPGVPWGVLAVQGRGVDELGREPRRPRSEIDHLILEGGSEDALKGAFYSGQLSVYHQDLVLRNAVLRGSFADDSLNVKYGHVAIADSSFTDSAADAIDLDWTDGTVTRSRFHGTGPGGDGLDLSGSVVDVVDSVFSGAGDKCLSVGEASSLRLRGSLLRNCALGLASKDSSRVDIADSVFLDNGRDLAAYRKKPIFGGATIRAERLLLVGAGEPPEADVLSEIEILASVQGGPLEGPAAGALAALESATVFSTDRYQRLIAALGPDTGEARP